VTIPLDLIQALGLYLLRTSALILGSPLLGSGTGFSGYKVALIIATTVAIFMSTGAPLAEPVGAMDYVLMGFHEVLIGVFLAFTLQVVLLAVRVAGELIGTEMAFNMASIVDPTTGINTPLVTQIYELVFFLGLLSVNGHHWLLRALSSSFDRAPIGAIGVAEETSAAVLELFTNMFAAGIVFSAPVLMLLMMVSVLIGFLSRVVPQINVMEMGFNIRVGIGLLAIFAFSPFIAPAMNRLFEELLGGLDRCLDVIGA
jgi:flagellar biosynthetic protein FliR